MFQEPSRTFPLLLFLLSHTFLIKTLRFTVFILFHLCRSFSICSFFLFQLVYRRYFFLSYFQSAPNCLFLSFLLWFLFLPPSNPISRTVNVMVESRHIFVHCYCRNSVSSAVPDSLLADWRLVRAVPVVYASASSYYPTTACCRRGRYVCSLLSITCTEPDCQAPDSNQ
jgi:hypothetical protein